MIPIPRMAPLSVAINRTKLNSWGADLVPVLFFVPARPSLGIYSDLLFLPSPLSLRLDYIPVLVLFLPHLARP